MQSISASVQERREAVVRLIAQGKAANQKVLVEALAAQGIQVTQATLSRDLRDLGAQKGPGGYSVAGAAGDPLVAAMGTWLQSATAAQNLLVLKTPPGGASPLAVALDASDHPDIVGTIAGDDTIMVIAPSAKIAAALAQTFGQYASAEG